MGTIAARNAMVSINDLSEVLAVLALVVARGMDVAQTGGAYSEAAERLHSFVRDAAEPMEADRSLSAEIAALALRLRKTDPSNTI